MKAHNERSVFSRNLVRFRKQLHLTQAQIADLTGISQRIIAHYETRVIDPPGSVLLTLSKVLGVSINELLEEKPIPPDDASRLNPKILHKALEIAKLPKKDRAMIYNLIKKLRDSNSVISEEQPAQ